MRSFAGVLLCILLSLCSAMVQRLARHGNMKATSPEMHGRVTDLVCNLHHCASSRNSVAVIQQPLFLPMSFTHILNSKWTGLS